MGDWCLMFQGHHCLDMSHTNHPITLCHIWEEQRPCLTFCMIKRPTPYKFWDDEWGKNFSLYIELNMVFVHVQQVALQHWQSHVCLLLQLTLFVCAVKNFLAVNTISQWLQLYILPPLGFVLVAGGTSFWHFVTHTGNFVSIIQLLQMV